MRFLVIEGLDGSGKSTQVELLREYLHKKGVRYRYLHFPRLEEGIYGQLIARFLRGEMGEIGQVDPYLVALIFAGDRMDAKEMMEGWLNDGELVLVDRYVYSNIAFQCAKLVHERQQEELARWIAQLEFDYHHLPVPDVNIFLDVPPSFTEAQLSASRMGEDREYLKGGKDIHEQDVSFQQQVRRLYLSLPGRFDNICVVDCSDGKGNMLAPDQVFWKLLEATKL